MIAWLTDTLIATGALIALVLVLRRPAARHFGPQISYALWALPLLRFALPPLVLPASLAPRAAAMPAAALVADASAGMPAGIVALPAYELSFWDRWGGVLVGTAISVWLAGALTFLAWRAWTYVRMRAWLLEGARPMGEAGKVRLVESPAVSAPVAFGVSDKVVALPVGFMASENRAARDLAIEHELAHHRGRDLLANILAQPILALHWFNPLAWLGWRAMRRDQEAACDARVIAARGPWERAAYGQVIASFAAGQRLALAAPMACPVLGEKSIIHRLRSLGRDEVSPRRRLAGRLLVGAAALALPFTASVSYAAADTEGAPPATAEPPRPEIRTDGAIVIVDVRGGADPNDPKLHTRVIERDGRRIILKTEVPVSDEEAAARIARAPLPPVVRTDPMVEPDVARIDRDRADADRRWANYTQALARQGEQSAKAGEAWAKWAEQFGQSWAAWGEKVGKAASAAAPAAPAPPHAPAAPRAPVPPAAPAYAYSYSYDCDGDGNLVKIQAVPGAGETALHAGRCAKLADVNASARRALLQARGKIANDPRMDPDTRDKVLDALDDEIDDLADADDPEG
ncbi:MAG: antirepressor regulating drug resistance protein [Novosphingobium sp.]|nr:antirepressor regulating drug resistance protein [Novosphingobium sp.]MBO9603045.1 antirepressor regulating drug resistance protein [Novosphingobium sp.]